MSGTAPEILGDPNSPDLLSPDEVKAYQRSLELQKIGASAVPPGIASIVLPPESKDGITSLKNYVPGIVPQTYEMISGLKKLGEMGYKAVTGGDWQNATGLPGSETAHEMATGSRATANRLVPHIEPTPGDQGQEIAADIGNIIGMSAPFGAAGGLVKGLPRAAQTAVGVLAPQATMKSVAPVSAMITGGVDAITGSDAAQERAHNAPIDVTDVLKDDDTLPVPPIPPAHPPAATQPMDVTHILNQPIDISDGVMGEKTKPGLLGNQPTAWTLGEVAAFGGAAIALIAGRKQATQFLDTMVGGLREKMYQGQANAFNGTEAALNAGATNLPHVEAPVPVRGGDLSTDWSANVVNSNARIQAYTDVIAKNKLDADIMRAETGMINNSQAFHGRVADIATTGVDKTTGVTMPSIVDHWTRVSQFTPDQTKLFSQARYYADELDNRKALNGQPVNFPNTDMATLRQGVADARADPVVAAELDTINDVHRKMAAVLRASDYISPAEEAQLVAAHPNYLASVNHDGSLQGTIGPRDLKIGGGLDNIPIHASEVDKQHFTDLFRQAELNAWRRQVVDAGVNYQNRTPGAAKIFTPNKFNGEWVKSAAEGDTLTLRRNGQTENWKVGNTSLLRDMTAGNQQMNVAMAGMNYMRILMQSGITGPLSALTGHFFPAVNTMRNTVHGSMFQAPGMAYGPITSLIQKATGNIGHLPVLSQADAVLGSLSGLMQGIGAVGAQTISHVLDRANTNIAQTFLRSSLGDPWVDAAATRMAAAWDTSIRAEMKKNGILNASGYGSAELPAKQLGARKMNASPLNNLVPELFRANGMLGGVTPKLVRLRAIYNELADVVNEASQTHLYSTNKGKVPQQVLNHEVRNFIGDPGRHGGNPRVRAATQMIPYGNMIIQDVARIGRAFAEQPLSSAYKSISTLGTLALASNYSALLAGPEHVDHLTERLTDDQHASKVYFYVPGLAPEASPYIDLPQNIRVMYPIMLQAAHDALNVQGSNSDPDFSAHVMDWLHAYFSRHVTNDTVDASIAGMSSNISPGLPPAAVGAAALAGYRAEPTLYNQVMPGETAIHKLGGDSSAPGHEKGTDSLTGTVIGNHITHAVASMLGIAGSSILQAYGSLKAGEKRGKDAMEMLPVIGEQEVDRLKDIVPFMRGTVFSNQSKLSGTTPLVARVEEARELMQPLRTWKSDAKYGPTDDFPGMTRAKGQIMDQMPMKDNKIPRDPLMAQAYETYGAYASYIDRKMYPQISDIRKQINNLASDPGTPDEIKAKHNAYQKQLRPLYETLAGVINDADRDASKILGRPVSILKIDWKKGQEQFQRGN